MFFFSTAILQRHFIKTVADIAASKRLDLSVWDDGVYRGDNPYPRTDFKSRYCLAHQIRMSACFTCTYKPYLTHVRGWSGGAMALGNLPVLGRPTNLARVGQGLLLLQ